jgi:predicted GNAT family acetyltransferase
VRVLGRHDVDEALALCARDLVANLFVASRLYSTRHRGAGGEFWGWYDGGELRSLCWSGANLVPVEATPEALEVFADRARRQGRQCSSIVGPSTSVLSLWDQLEAFWGPARDVRPDQPLMVTSSPPLVDPDPLVRLVHPDELDLLLPASIAMFTEEVGISPVAGDGGALYRARVSELVHSGRSFARVEDGRIVFKAEVGAATRAACQIQGVWVDPSRRGSGMSVAGMAAVVAECLRSIAPAVSLYVNDFNTPARRAYERVGFTTVGTFMSVLF